MRILIAIIVCLCAGALPLAAQTAFPGGLVLDDDAAYDTIPMLSRHPGLKTSLPASVSLEAYCPEVRHQGDIFSCVGWAVGYGALSIQRAIHNQCTDRRLITQHAHSALFLFNQIKEDCQKGAKLSDAMRFLQEHGNCLARDFDLDVNDCTRQPSADQTALAKRFAIAGYATLFEASEPYAVKVEQVKTALAHQKPVVVGMQVRRNFYQLAQAKFWWPELGNTTPAGGHAMVVVGYDDRAGAFRLLNSWGTNWGDNGFIWVKYEHFAQFAKYAYVIQLTGTAAPMTPQSYEPAAAASPEVALAGAFQFRSLQGYHPDTGAPQFADEPVVWNGRYYTLEKKDWETGQLFQLWAMTKLENEYLYVLSVDAQRQAKVHFPRQETTTGRKVRESGLILPGNATLVVPGPTRALQLAHPGADRLIVLFSRRPLGNLEGLCQALSQYEGDFWGYLMKIIGRYAIPPTDIRYDNARMQFNVHTQSQAYIVPIVLEVQTRQR